MGPLAFHGKHEFWRTLVVWSAVGLYMGIVLARSAPGFIFLASLVVLFAWRVNTRLATGSSDQVAGRNFWVWLAQLGLTIWVASVTSPPSSQSLLKVAAVFAIAVSGVFGALYAVYWILMGGAALVYYRKSETATEETESSSE